MAPAGEKISAGFVLGIETATSRGGIALCRNGEVLGELLLDNPRSHSERLLPAIEVLLRTVSLGVENLAAVSVSAGPGSFTGLRIGVAAAKGLAFSRGIPLYGISSLRVLAANASPGTKSVCAVIDARRGEVFSGLFRATPAGPRRAGAERISRPEDLAADLPPGTLVLGQPPSSLSDLLKKRRKDGIVRAPAYQNIPRAAVVAVEGEALLRARRPSETESLVPFYLRPSDAEANRKAGVRRRRTAQHREKA
jgi:tRNA threonylcarbamoyladenosine biosynthesis protein TsaB